MRNFIPKLIHYVQANPVEIRVMSLSTLGSVAFPFELILKFIIPLASGIAWFFLKPKLEEWRNNQNKTNHDKDKC